MNEDARCEPVSAFRSMTTPEETSRQEDKAMAHNPVGHCADTDCEIIREERDEILKERDELRDELADLHSQLSTVLREKEEAIARSQISDDDWAKLTFSKHLADEANAAHKALDRAGIPAVKSVLNRRGDGQQDITIGLGDRVKTLTAHFDTERRAREAAEQERDALKARLRE